MFTTHEIYPNLYFLKFKEFIQIGLTFWRYQEYYESKFFKGRVMSLPDFITEYWKKNDNDFSYFGYWDGFNVPSYVLKEVWRKMKDETKYDTALKKFTEKIGKKDFYLVSSFAKSADTIRHEIAHGLYYLNSKYRNEINRELSKLPIKFTNHCVKVLRKASYHKCVHRDEIQAYLIAGQDEDIDFREDILYRKRFLKVFMKYGRNIKL